MYWNIIHLFSDHIIYKYILFYYIIHKRLKNHINLRYLASSISLIITLLYGWVTKKSKY